MSLLHEKIIKYPRYTREQKLNCKLTENDIEEILKLHSQGFTGAWLAKKFGVVKSTIYRYTNPENAKIYDKKRRLYGKYRTKEQLSQTNKNFRKRKKQIQPQWCEFMKFARKNYKMNNPERTKAEYKKWYKKHGARYYGIKRGYLKYKMDGDTSGQINKTQS